MPTTTKYIWDDDNLLAEADGSDVIHTVYTNEPGQYGNLISTRLPVGGTPTTVYHHYDALGSTRALTNAAGTVTDTMIYDAWGNVVNRTGTTAIAFLWVGLVGYYFDVETAELYIRERMYRPLIGRWTAVDPMPAIPSASRYVYGLNRPHFVTDPSGKVVLIFNPKETKDMPWTIFNDPEEKLPNPKTTLGFTSVRRRPFITASCLECCECPKGLDRCGSVDIIIEVTALIFINCKNVHVHDRTESGAYAHEQLHVENVRRFAEKIEQLAAAYEKKHFCNVSWDDCTAKFRLGDNPLSYPETDLEQMLETWIEAEVGHRRNPGFPAPPGPTDTAMRPIGGTMPPKDTTGRTCADLPY